MRTRVLTSENGRVELSQRDLDPMFSLIDSQDLSGVRVFLSGVVCSTHTHRHTINTRLYARTRARCTCVFMYITSYLARTTRSHDSKGQYVVFAFGRVPQWTINERTARTIPSFNVLGIGLWNISPFRPWHTSESHWVVPQTLSAIFQEKYSNRAYSLKTRWNRCTFYFFKSRFVAAPLVR